MAGEAETETKSDGNATVEDGKKVEETPKEAAKETKENDTKEEAKKDEPKKAEKGPKPTVHKTDFKENRVYLYQFSRTSQLPSLSPFCLKVETWLRVTKLEYENVDHKMKFRSKKGLLPFVELNGKEYNDSANIIKELGKIFEKDLDQGLSAQDSILSHTTCSMIENHLYWVLYWWRSKYPGRFLKGSEFDVKEALGSKIPKGILDFLFKLRFKQGQKRVRAHGLGVHTAEEVEEFGRSDLQTLSSLLGEKNYFFGGEEPTLLDLTAFSVLAQFVYYKKSDDAPFTLHDWLMEKCPNLKDFVNRIKDKYFPDWEEMCKNLDLNSHLPKPPPPAPKEEEEKKKEEGKKEEEEKTSPAAEEKTTPKEEQPAENDKKD